MFIKFIKMIQYTLYDPGYKIKNINNNNDKTYHKN